MGEGFSILQRMLLILEIDTMPTSPRDRYSNFQWHQALSKTATIGELHLVAIHKQIRTLCSNKNYFNRLAPVSRRPGPPCIAASGVTAKDPKKPETSTVPPCYQRAWQQKAAAFFLFPFPARVHEVEPIE